MHKRWLFLVWVFLLAGCTAMKIEDFRGAQPRLVLEDYFLGETHAWGFFEDRFGTLRRQFRVSIQGRMEGESLILDERFVYADGERDRRVWRIEPLGEGRYRGEADDILGVAQGQTAGNALNWRYRMDLPVGDSSWRVTFNDWMWLQPGGVLVNRATVSKWGVELGRVVLFFSKQAEAKDEDSRSVEFKPAPVAKPANEQLNKLHEVNPSYRF